MSDPSTLWLLAGCDPTGGAGLWRDLATAIACGLARGRTLPQAVASAVAWLDVVRAWTHPGPDGRLFSGFIEGSADKIFESTDRAR